MKSVNIASVIIAGNIMNVLSAIVAEIMQILQNQIKQNVRTEVQMNPYTAKTQRCVVHRSRFSWCNQEGVGSTLAAAKIVNNFNPQN